MESPSRTTVDMVGQGHRADIETKPEEELDTRQFIATDKQACFGDEQEEHEQAWGFRDTQYELTPDGAVEISGTRYSSSGHKLPHLVPWITNLMQIQVTLEMKPFVAYGSNLADTRDLDGAILSELQVMFRQEGQGVGTGGFSVAIQDRIRSSHGHALEEMHNLNFGQVGHRIPDVVIYPSTTDQVQAIMALARRHNVLLMPYGGGTNVSHALTCTSKVDRTLATISTCRMNRVVWVDKFNRLAHIQAGAVGRHITSTLAAYGVTIGHEPDSAEFSSLGGWIATKASGMKRGRYGNIEDLVLDMELVTYGGKVIRTSTHGAGDGPHLPVPRESVGSDFHASVFGSEGRFGVITSATVKVFTLPETQKFGSILFRDWLVGVAFLHDLVTEGLDRHGGLCPASVRLVDNAQFQFSQALKPASTSTVAAWASWLQKSYVTRWLGFDPRAMAACTLLFEGSAAEVVAQERLVAALVRKHGGLAAGAENGRRGYDMTFAIAYIRDFAMRIRILAESFETSCAWSAVGPLCTRVKARVEAEYERRGLPGKPFITARVSQVYPTGVTVYFYLAIFVEGVADPARVYAELEEAARDEILQCGGSLSHHHGVGALRRGFLGRVVSPAARRVWDAVRGVMDPDGLFGGDSAV